MLEELKALQEENTLLHSTVADYQNDIRQLGKTLISTLNTIGLNPTDLANGESPMKKILAVVPNLMMESQIDPTYIDKTFVDLKSLAPLLSKYQPLIED
tara:strand:- start:4070 stop:4366 length:297 start_codon:yes stop_codon:yes gene_type:complete